MNQIKVKGWHNKAKKMFSAEEMGRDQLTLMPNGRGFVNVSSVNPSLSTFPDMIPLLGSGITAQNGAELHVGDLVRINRSDLFEVKFGEYGTYNSIGGIYYTSNGFYLEGQRITTALISLDKTSFYHIEGNKYENPELFAEVVKNNKEEE